MKSWRLPFAVSVLTLIGLAACVADDPVTGDDTNGNDASTDGTVGNDGSAPDGSTPTGDSGVDSGPKRDCQTISAPDGSADFFCADFDGTQFDEEFPDGSATVTDGSTLGLTQDVAISKPNALVSNSTGNDGDQ